MSEPRPTARLRCRSGKLAGQTFDLGAKTTIGRDPESDIVLESPTVSKHHARIVFSDGQYVLEDLESTHGTKVDGTRISAPTALPRMHVVEVSDVEFIYTPGPTPSIPEEESGGVDGAPEPNPASPPQEPANGLGGATIVDTGGFGTLPDLRDTEEDDPNRTQVMTSFPTEPLVRLEIVVTLSDQNETTFPLGPGDNILGRGDDCDISIQDPSMWLSRAHVNLRVSGGRVELIDLGSVNGTFVDGKRIETATLEPGSTFVLGPHLKIRLQAR